MSTACDQPCNCGTQRRVPINPSRTTRKALRLTAEEAATWAGWVLHDERCNLVVQERARGTRGPIPATGTGYYSTEEGYYGPDYFIPRHTPTP